MLDGQIILWLTHAMQTIPAIFDALNGPAEVARLLGVKTSTASEMKRRKVIAVKYWPKLVKICKSEGVRGVNYDVLVALHQKEGV